MLALIQQRTSQALLRGQTGTALAIIVQARRVFHPGQHPCQIKRRGSHQAGCLGGAQEGEGEEAGEEVHMLEDVQVGVALEGLAFQLLDEEGQPTCPGLKGRKETAWSRGSKRCKLAEDGSPEELPPLQVSMHHHATRVRSVGCGLACGRSCAAAFCSMVQGSECERPVRCPWQAWCSHK